MMDVNEVIPSILDVQNLSVQFNTLDGIVHAVNNVSFTIDQGETMAIVGESGCGKSVSFLSLLRLIPEPPGRITSGRAFFDDGRTKQDLLAMSKAEIRQVRGSHIGIVFQDPLTSLNPIMPVGQQISETLIEHKRISERAARKQTIELLDRVGIPGAAKRYSNYPHQFSGGMRQRVMIAIAIACMPRILIADEPTTALDVTIQAQIVDLITHIRDELKMAILWITHDLSVVAGMADRVMVMYGGMVAERARVDDLYEDPRHPYTLGLLGALPRLDSDETRRLVSIEGSPPDLYTAPAHCQFAFRCPFAFERCWNEIPQIRAVGPRHKLACFYDIPNRRPWNG
jgi:oligopeptide transport system ATP-binding protein